jgi:hypothetical protein
MNNLLYRINLARSPRTDAACIFEGLFGEKTFLEIEYSRPSEYVEKYWTQYKSGEKQKRNVNGKIFEYIIATLFIRENIMPFYLQAKVAFVPNAIFDNIIYCKQFGPIAFSMKTTLRERYKQADLEGVSLKYVHRKAQCYLLTLDESERNRVSRKIKDGEVIGLDEAILCTSKEFDDMIERIKSYDLSLAGNVDVISSNQIISNDIMKKLK